MKSLLLCKMALIKEQPLSITPTLQEGGRVAERRGRCQPIGPEKQQASGSLRGPVSKNKEEGDRGRCPSLASTCVC